MFFARSRFVIVTLLALVSAGPTTKPLAKFEPPDGVTYHGVCLPGIWDEHETQQNLAAFQKNVTDRPLVLHSWFAHARENGHWRTWHWMNTTPDGDGCQGPVKEYAERSRKLHLVPVIAWAWDDFQHMDKSPSVQDVAAGKQDWLIDDWIAGCKQFKDPIFIRLSHEMDGNWYPYSEGYDKNPKRNTAADFVAYWKHIVDRFRAAGVTNVAWVWCVNGDSAGGIGWKPYYPGDEYVDWIGLDAYSSRNPSVYIEPLIKQFGHKPIMIPEGGTIDDQTKWNRHFVSNAAWTKELFDEIEKHPQIKGLCWFEYGRDSNIERDADQLAEYQKRIAEPRYTVTFGSR